MTAQATDRPLTVLFTDVVGSTHLHVRAGDVLALEILDVHERMMNEGIARFGGRRIKSMGDGIMVAFDSPSRGVACALDVQRNLDEHNRLKPTSTVRVRMGLNVGTVVERDGDLYGTTVIAAARVVSKARAGQVLVTSSIRDGLVQQAGVTCVSRGLFWLKGFPERWRLYEARSGELGVTNAGASFVEPTDFVGRERELADLRRLLDQVAEGQGTLVAVGGDAGVGKTRFTAELAAQADAAGFVALVGRCYEREGVAPFGPFIEILEEAARLASPEDFRTLLGDSATEMARLMPQLRRMYPDLPPPAHVPVEHERRYLFDSVIDFFRRASGVQPLMLVVEDVHWIDESSLAFLEHLARHLAELPLLVVLTYRDAELNARLPVATAIEELARARRSARVTLEPLSREEVAGLLEGLSGEQPPDSVVEMIDRVTEGNPFFIEEVFKHLAEQHELFDDTGRWRNDLDIDEFRVPSSIRLVVARRLERLSDAGRSLLADAAVVGRRFSFDLLEMVQEPGADSLLDAVEEAERVGLITPVAGDADASFCFAHELVRQTLLEGISLPRRRRIHLLLADAMESLYASRLEQHADDLAHHLQGADRLADPARCAHFLKMAGRHALQAAAFEDAMAHLDAALELQRAETPFCAEVLFSRGFARLGLGQWAEAMVDWRAALTIHEHLGDDDAIGRLAVAISQQLNWGARWLEAFEIAQRGLSAVGARGTPGRGSLLATVGLTLSAAGAYNEGGAMIDEALAITGSAEPELLGSVLLARATQHWCYMQMSDAVESGLAAADLQRAQGDLLSAAQTLSLTRYALTLLGRGDEARSLGAELDPVASRLGHPGALLVSDRSRGVEELMATGDLDRFEAFARADLQRCTDAGMPWTSHSYTWLALVRFWRGDWDEALATRETASAAELSGFSAGADWSYLFLSHAYEGRREVALSMLEPKRSQLPRSGQPNTLGSWTMLLSVVEGLAILGERDELSPLLPRVADAIATGVLLRWPGDRLIRTVSALASAACGRWARAEQDFRTAMRQADDLPHVLEAAEVRRLYADMLVARNDPGDRELGKDLLEEAGARYVRLGMPRHEAMAGQVLRSM